MDGESVPPPTEYKRMLSWQLSHAQEAPVVKSRKKQKKLQKRKAKEEEAATAAEHDCSSSEGEYAEQDGSGYAYLVVNSEGEEEWYYSAPESPVESGDEPWDAGDGGVQGSEVIGEAVGDTALPPQEKKRGGKTKKKKKKTRSVVRLAEVEFFGPLCDLVETSLSVEVDDLQLSSQVEVPSLTELCVRCVQKANLVQPASASEEDNLPFLVHALLGAHRDHRSLVSTHIRWLERLLAALELHLIANPIACSLPPGSSSSSPPPFAYCNRWLWETDISLADYPDPWTGMHLPLPFPQTTSVFHEVDYQFEPFMYHSKHIAALLHFTNYLFPLFTARGRASVEGHSGLSPSQHAAVAYVNSFITSRYKQLCLQHAETLKLWPAYVYWARGQLRLAATSFSTAIDSLKRDIDKGIALSELGRMFLTFGDRSNARNFFSKILEIHIKPDRDLHYTPTLMQASILALEASVWDCGWLNTGAARQAALVWSQVLSEAEDLPSGLWYLHLAGCESRMMVHAGRPVGSDPGSPVSATTPSSSPHAQWLSEIEKLVGRLCSKRLILHYHLSIIHAMAGRREEARRHFLSFYDDYAMFREWSDGLPGNLFSLTLHRHLLNPWNPLIDMLRDQGLSSAPVLQLQWRTRLLHPMYPYSKTSTISYLADHCSTAINLHLSESGLLTADAHMDLPPLRCIFLDPYTGSLCFSRSASFHHYYSGQMGGYKSSSFNRTPDELALPWPVRVLEVGSCVVELVVAGGVDLEASHATTNHSATLHWRQDGVHSKLDLRVAIRKELKKAILRLAADMGLKGKEDILKATMERGLSVTVNDLNRKEPPSKYSREEPYVYSPGRAKGKTKSQPKQKPQKKRNRYVYDFSLRLTDYVVYSEATLALCFSLLPMLDDNTHVGQVLVFVNCTSRDSFQQPRVLCVGDQSGFQYLYPSRELAVQYPGHHLPHVRYIVVCRSETTSQPEDKHWQLVIDQDGAVVHKEPLNVLAGTGTRRRHTHTVTPEDTVLKCSLGERVYNWRSQSHEVTSYSPQMKQKLESVPFPSLTLLSVVPIPGLLLVHTPRGLSLIHPGSLMPVEVEGLVSPVEGQADKNEEEPDKLVQIQAQDAIVNILCVYNVASGSGVSEADAEEPVLAGEGGSDVIDERGGDTATESTEREETRGGGGGGSGEAEKGESQEKKETRRRLLSEVDFGSCHVAVTVNNRLLILQVPHRTKVVSVLMDVLLPGKVTEIHPMGKFGFMLSATQFPDCFREEVYWLSDSGKLLGMLPCLGPGPRSFASATLEPRASNQLGGMTGSSYPEDEGEDDGGGLYVFFNDGQGGVCCVRPSVE